MLQVLHREGGKVPYGLDLQLTYRYYRVVLVVTCGARAENNHITIHAKKTQVYTYRGSRGANLDHRGIWRK